MAARREEGFRAYARSWLVDRPLKARTGEGYHHLLDRYLLPEFGALELGSISPALVRRWWASLDASTPTVNARAYGLLKAILNTAVADEVIVANPAGSGAPHQPQGRERSGQPVSWSWMPSLQHCRRAAGRWRCSALGVPYVWGRRLN